MDCIDPSGTPLSLYDTETGATSFQGDDLQHVLTECGGWPKRVGFGRDM